LYSSSSASSAKLLSPDSCVALPDRLLMLLLIRRIIRALGPALVPGLTPVIALGPLPVWPDAAQLSSPRGGMKSAADGRRGES